MCERSLSRRLNCQSTDESGDVQDSDLWWPHNTWRLHHDRIETAPRTGDVVGAPARSPSYPSNRESERVSLHPVVQNLHVVRPQHNSLTITLSSLLDDPSESATKLQTSCSHRLVHP
jgi:hypothetical protein